MKNKTLTTLLRLSLLAVLVLTINLTMAQTKAPGNAPQRNVITSGTTEPAQVTSKAAPAAPSTTANETVVTFDDGTSVPMTAQTKATYDAKPKLSAGEIASPNVDPKAMNAWVDKFARWRAEHPNDFTKALSSSEMKIVSVNGDMRQLYIMNHDAAYQQHLRETIRTQNGK